MPGPPGGGIARHEGHDRRAASGGSGRLYRAACRALRAVRHAPRPRLEPGVGALPQCRLLGAGRLRAPRGDGEGLCRRGRHHRGRRGSRPSPPLLRAGRLRVRSAALSRLARAQGRRARPGSAAAGLESAEGVRDVAPVAGGAAVVEEPVCRRQARVRAGPAPDGDVPDGCRARCGPGCATARGDRLRGGEAPGPLPHRAPAAQARSRPLPLPAAGRGGRTPPTSYMALLGGGAP